MVTQAKIVENPTGRIDHVVAILGGRAAFKDKIATRLDVHRAIEHGLPTAILTDLVRNVVLMRDSDTLHKALGTFYHQKDSAAPKTLSKEQSGAIWKFAEILVIATEIFGSQKAAEHWLTEPAIGLDRMRPIDLLSTAPGAELVETYLNQIEYGVYV